MFLVKVRGFNALLIRLDFRCPTPRCSKRIVDEFVQTLFETFSPSVNFYLFHACKNIRFASGVICHLIFIQEVSYNHTNYIPTHIAPAP